MMATAAAEINQSDAIDQKIEMKNDEGEETKDANEIVDNNDTTTATAAAQIQASQPKETKNTNTDALTDATSTNSIESASNGNITAKSPSAKAANVTSELDPDGIKLKFLFAGRDGLNVTVECKLTDTVGEIKGVLLSMWPKALPECNGGESLRLICMGKGILTPDSKTLADLQVPVFKTHPTPVNVSVKPDHIVAAEKAQKSSPNGNDNSSPSTNQGCSCVIL